MGFRCRCVIYILLSIKGPEIIVTSKLKLRRSWKIGKRSEKCCYLDVSWLKHASIHSICIAWTRAAWGQDSLVHTWRRFLWGPTPHWGELVVFFIAVEEGNGGSLNGKGGSLNVIDSCKPKHFMARLGGWHCWSRYSFVGGSLSLCGWALESFS